MDKPKNKCNSDTGEQWFEHTDIDLSLLNDLIDKSKELGPAILRDSKYDPIFRPFDLFWTFGFNISIPVINMAFEDRHEIFFVSSNIGIIYNYCKKEMIHLKGHQSNIVSASVDKSGRWLVTADSGKDNMTIIWDTQSSEIVWTIFKHPSSEYNVILVALSPSAKILITITNENGNTIHFWLWTLGKNAPDDSYSEKKHNGQPKAILFHPNREDHIMIVFEKTILFFCWDFENSKIKESTVPKTPPVGTVGHFTDGTYVEFCHECFVGTSKGNVLVFGNTLYAKNYNYWEGDNNKMYIKCIKISKESINAITTADEIIVTGDAIGTILFFDKRLKLLFWFSTLKLKSQSISNISLKLIPRKYEIVEDFGGSLIMEKVMSNCDEDRSDEYEILIKTKIPKDATLEKHPFVSRDFFVSTYDGTIYLVNFVKQSFTPLFPSAGSSVVAIDVHHEKPYILIAYEKNNLILYNYETHEEVMSANLPKKLDEEEESSITTINFSPECLHLACGKSNGEVWMLHPALLTPVYTEPLKFSTLKIKKILFSGNSILMAYYDDNMTVFAFCFDAETEDWVFKGKVRSHYKEITNMLFTEEEPFDLFSMGRDRHVIKYTRISLKSEDIDIDIRDRIEQKDIPLYFIHYPKKKFSKSGYFLEADDKHKFKILSIKTSMCTGVYLGPAYGCWEDSPVCKMEFVPKSNKNYLIFMNNKQIGLQLMPIDGNPYRFVGCFAHPDKLLDFQISRDGKYVFTAGENDRSIRMWKIKIVSVETLFQLGGKELQPFYCLINGGKSGFLFQEMRDLFYYMQILQQGEHVCAPRKVSDSINIVELPDLMRSCGYYPSEYEIENLLTDIRYKIYDEEGVTKDKVSFCEFVKLFINHKPAYGYSLETVEGAFNAITTFTDEFESGEITRDDFIEALTTTGESFSSEQLYRCLTTLLHYDTGSENLIGERDFSFLPSVIYFDTFTDDILGLDLEGELDKTNLDLPMEGENSDEPNEDEKEKE